MKDEELTERIVSCAMKVHSVLGPGFTEEVYLTALSLELRNAGLKVSHGNPFTVPCDDAADGGFPADILVEGRVVLGLTARRGRAPASEMQLEDYLADTGIGTGLLLNFGGACLDFKCKKWAHLLKNIVMDEPVLQDFPR